jgi:DNA-directed RNA polymerase specialized sigma24 family protein
MNLVEALQAEDMDEIIDRMNGYAINRLRSLGVKDFDGVEPIDFVGEVLEKVVKNQREWAKARCSFKEFLFGCLKSEISNFFKKRKTERVVELSDDIPHISQDLSEQRKLALALLREHGATDDEISVFECWADGILKPADISTELNIPVNRIYTVVARLERRLIKVRSQAKSSL